MCISGPLQFKPVLFKADILKIYAILWPMFFCDTNSVNRSSEADIHL